MEKIKNEAPLQTGRRSRHSLLRLIVAIGVIAFAVTITAVSCGKTAGGGNNNANNSGSGNNGGGGNATCTGICPTTNLVLANTITANLVKVSENTVTINANRLAGITSPHSDANDDNRGFKDANDAAKRHIFNIDYPGLKAVLFFISRAHVTKDTITMKAAATGATGTMPDCTSSESGDEALARAVGGAHCRKHSTSGDDIYFFSYLGTVFNNTNTTSHARGLMQCSHSLYKNNPLTGSNDPINDTLTFDANRIGCFLAVVNSAGTAAAAEIDDAWITDSGTTSEVELYAIGIDVTGKGMSQWSDAAGYGLTEFKKAHDNADFKRLLRTNPWGELKFKVKIVASTSF